MRDSDIDSLSADGAQEPWPTDSAEALLREALERLERVLSHPASSAHWDTGPNGGEIAGAMVQARAALQASTPSPAAEGSGELDRARVLQALVESGLSYEQLPESDTDRFLEAYYRLKP